MIDISDPIGEETAQNYYKEKWSRDDYYTQGNQLQGYWYGNMQEYLGLSGPVSDKDFARIMGGRRPDALYDPEQLADKWQQNGPRYSLADTAGNQVAEVYVTENGWRHSLDANSGYRTSVAAQNAARRELLGQAIFYRKSEESRRAWDIVCRPGKSVAVTAVVGGDNRVIKLHRRANAAMLDYLQQMIQARGGGNNPDITTGKFLVARFEHYTSRPEEAEKANGEKVMMPCALLHTHNVMANMTITPDGQLRSIDPHEMFLYQRLGKQVYQAYMAHGLRELGYRVEFGKNGSPEIAGYTEEYLKSESLRTNVIQKDLEALGVTGARAAAIIAHRNRHEKLDISPEETMALLKANAAAHGNQAEPIIQASLERSHDLQITPLASAKDVVTLAKKSLAEQYAVFDHWDLMTKALEYGQGYVLAPEIEQEIRSRTQTMEQHEQGIKAEFMLAMHERIGKPGIRYTTDLQHGYESQVCGFMVAGRNKVQPIAPSISHNQISDEFFRLTGGVRPNKEQIAAAQLALTSPDQVTGLVGAAGTGKTTVLQTIQSFSLDRGMQVIGVAATTKAVQQLEESGIHSVTLQGFLEANSPATKLWATNRLAYFDERADKITDRLAGTRQKLEAAHRSLAVAASPPRIRTRSVRAKLAQNRKRFERFNYFEEKVAYFERRIPELEQKLGDQRLKKAEFRAKVVRNGTALDSTPRYILADESSLAATRQYHQMLNGFQSRPQDRCLLVGDPAQHESIEAARVFDLMLQSGLRSASIHEIVRQRNPEIKAIVEKCQLKKHAAAFDLAMEHGLVHVMKRAPRLEKLIERYLENPAVSGIINPDNDGRKEINNIVREKLKEQNLIEKDGVTTIVLVPRQDLSGADREMAFKYEPGDVIRFRYGSDVHNIQRGTYWKVCSTDPAKNEVSIYREQPDGTIDKRTFNPSQLTKIEVYKSEERELCIGDKIIFRKRSRELDVVNGTVAFVQKIEGRKVTAALARLDRSVTWDVPLNQLSAIPHIEYGHAATSYSIQGTTNDRTFAHFDTSDPKAKKLITQAMFYVATSRPKDVFEIYTNDPVRLRSLLTMESEKGMALSPEERQEYIPDEWKHHPMYQHHQGQEIGIGA